MILVSVEGGGDEDQPDEGEDAQASGNPLPGAAGKAAAGLAAPALLRLGGETARGSGGCEAVGLVELVGIGVGGVFGGISRLVGILEVTRTQKRLFALVHDEMFGGGLGFMHEEYI